MSESNKLIPDEKDDTLYQVVSDRRISHDTLMWETPVLSLTAQAFLFTVAFDNGAAVSSRIIAASLSIIAAAASIQLMARHGNFEEAGSKWLEAYERKHFPSIVPPHGKNRPCHSPVRYWEKLPSRKVWLGALFLFGFAGVAAIIVAIWDRNPV